jgi:copper transport protein
MRRLVLGTLALLCAAGAAVALPLHASAHALAQSSDPAEGSTVDTSPATVTITFGEPPDPRLSTIRVLNTSGQSYDTGPTQAVSGNDDQLRVAVRPLPRGVYTVSWRTVSMVDGHFASGAFAFGVGVSAQGAAAGGAASNAGTPPPSALAVAGRWMLFAGLVLLLGAAFAALLVFRAPPPTTLPLLAIGWLLTAAGTFAIAQAQRAAADVSWSDVFATSLGHTLVTRIIPAAVAGAGVAAVWRLRGRLRTAAVAVTGLAAAGAMWADAAGSHAAGQSPTAFNLLAQWLHVVAVGVWIGGLAALLPALRGVPSADKAAAARRLSTAAAVALVVVTATGIARSVIEVESWGNLTGTAFGKLVILKLALVGVLAGLGAVNRLRNVPAAARALRGLRVVGSTEVVAGAAALLVAAALVNVAPPVSSAQASTATAQPLTVSGSDEATTVRVRLEVSPGTPGFNRFTARVTDYDSGAPVGAQSVQLSFRMAARPDLGSSTLTLARAGDGSWSGRGANLSIDGAWQVTVLVERGAESAEVGLRLTTRSLPQRIDVSRVPGEPTLYTIHLTQGRTVQVYIDPDRRGPLEFHSTFFDAAGHELPVTSATIVMTPPGANATPQTLAARQLEPGHYVADATLGAGAYRFDISGSTSGGETLTTHIDITAAT